MDTCATQYEASIESLVNDSEVTWDRLTALSADLCAYATALETIAMIDHTTAVSLEALETGILDTIKYPLSSFTTQPSKTNYSVSVERISEHIEDIGRRILESIIRLFRQIGDFFIKLWNTVFAREAQQTKYREQKVKVEKEIVYLLQNTPVPLKPTVEAAVAYTRSHLDDLLHDDVEAINNDLLDAIIHHKPEHRAAVAIGQSFVAMIESILKRIVFLEAEIIVITDNPSQSKAAIYNIQEETDSIKWHAASVVPLLQSMGLLRSKFTSSDLADAVSQLRYRIKDLVGDIHHPHVTVDAILKSDATRSIVKDGAAISAVYGKLKAAVDHMDRLTTRKMPADVHREIMALAVQIRKEYHAATHFLAIANHYATIATEVLRLELYASMHALKSGKDARKGNPKE